MRRLLAVLSLAGVMAIPVAAVAQSGSPPLGTLDEFQTFLTDHGFPDLVFRGNLPDEPTWEVTSGHVTVFAEARTETALDLVEIAVAINDMDDAERQKAQSLVMDFFARYAPDGRDEILAVEYQIGMDTVIALDDRAVRIAIPDSAFGPIVYHYVTTLAASGFPVPSNPAGSDPPAIVSPLGDDGESFSGTSDFNTARFDLGGGDYYVTWSAEGGTGCFVAFELTGSSATFDVASLLVEGKREGANNIYDVPAARYFLAVTGDCPWSVTIVRQ